MTKKKGRACKLKQDKKGWWSGALGSIHGVIRLIYSKGRMMENSEVKNLFLLILYSKLSDDLFFKR